ncbi:preprotein translocase subunit SecG [Blattabacterium cuenoti]|uniref:preprotein translocase subunit SecG n=1 Tax=Blattabacterium cuenoti TaxID=1653831 RepID=UPI00163CDAAB|nr:preprotein translocase subunit SecG [Blattabacterium cuenoti]
MDYRFINFNQHIFKINDLYRLYIINFISFIIVIISIFFILIILIQNPKKESINQSFMEKNFRFFGIKRTNTFLDNITWLLSITILVLILIFNFLLKKINY